MISPLLLAQLAGAPAGPPPHVASRESMPLQDISCELRTLDFEETARIVLRQSGGRAYNRGIPGASQTPNRTPVTIEVVSDETGVLEKSYAPEREPLWSGSQPFTLGGSFQYLRFQPVPFGGRPSTLAGVDSSVPYVVDVMTGGGFGQLVGRCDMKSKKQAPLSASETREFLRR